MKESFLDHRLTALGEENKEDIQKIFFAVKFQGGNSQDRDVRGQTGGQKSEQETSRSSFVGLKGSVIEGYQMMLERISVCLEVKSGNVS